MKMQTGRLLLVMVGALTLGVGNCSPPARADLYVVSDRTDSVLRYDDATGAYLGLLDDQGHSGFNGAIGLTFGPDGGLYLCRGYANAVFRYSPGNSGFQVFTSGGDLSGPHTCAFGGPDNDLYVANYGNGTVQRFDGVTGIYKSTIASGLGSAVGVAVDAAGNVYIASRSSGDVYKYDGNTLTTFAAGIGAETLYLLPDGYLYVSSGGLNKILRYKLDGTPWGAGGNTMDPTFASGGGLNSPQGITFGPDNNLYVSSYYSNNVLRYNGVTGEFIDVFTQPGGDIQGAWGLVFTPGVRHTVSGHITLEDCMTPGQTVTLKFRPINGGLAYTTQVIVAADGSYTASAPVGNYNVLIKGAKWLAASEAVDTTNGDVTGVNALLRAGDANNDNIIDVEDLNQLIQAFDADPTSPNWNGGKADFNCDDIVSVDDLDILIRNFDAGGDP